METYPYPSSEGIIDLVRKSEFDRLKWELEEQRAELTRWQSLAGLLAAPLDFIVTKTDAGKICFHNLYDSTAEMAHKALTAYESATPTTDKLGTAQ